MTAGGHGRLRKTSDACCRPMPGRTHADMMRTMAKGNSTDPVFGDRQPDLFDDRGRVEGEVATPPRVPPAELPVAALSDAELIAMLPQAGRSNVGGLCAEVVSRRLSEAVPALKTLWRRFSGFGVSVPYPEQRAVLSTLARLDCEAARAALRALVLAKGLPVSLLPAAARAALEAGLVLPAAFVAPLLAHEDVAVREPAFALAVQAGVGSDGLQDGLTDPSPAVRRLAAIAMGMRGDAAARERLVEELERNPTAEVIEALAGVGDDDAIVHLGRCAERYPALAESVLEALRDMESAKAERLVRRLEADLPTATARALTAGEDRNA